MPIFEAGDVRGLGQDHGPTGMQTTGSTFILHPYPACRDDMASLKRLVREAFAEVTDHGGRLHRLEQRAASGGSGGWTTGADLAPSAAADITFLGAVEVAPALVLSQVNRTRLFFLKSGGAAGACPPLWRTSHSWVPWRFRRRCCCRRWKGRPILSFPTKGVRRWVQHTPLQTASAAATVCCCEAEHRPQTP